ncbi:threonylcarbamoyl-AMP synthase [Candidatus Sumerlaeota bacterium]|nr:threonylcarbamoyl-AMP synthase [Candidatus Sumerlaeota bacterium]
MTAQIGIVLGSSSDVDRIEGGLDLLRVMEIPFEIEIASAHRTPDRLARWLADAEARGVRVIVAAAGAAAHLPGVVASKTLLPVVGLPLDASPLHGTDALYSIVQMPPGVPVATVGIDSAENAVILALHILAVSEASIREKLRSLRASWADKIESQNVALTAKYRKSAASSPLSPPDESKKMPEDSAPTRPGRPIASSKSVPRIEPTRSRPDSRIQKLDPDAPYIDVIERAVDVLLSGGVVAFPTDTVYGLAADATNPEAVEKLHSIKGREADKALPVLIDSLKMFGTLSVEIPEGIDDVIDRHWPGPLTLVVRKRSAALKAVSPDDTLGLRMPDNMIALGLINMLARPLASTSANRTGERPASTAQEVEEILGDKVDLILDGGPTPGSAVSTVLSLVEEPFRVLRQGILEHAALKEILGDQLA